MLYIQMLAKYDYIKGVWFHSHIWDLKENISTKHFWEDFHVFIIRQIST